MYQPILTGLVRVGWVLGMVCQAIFLSNPAVEVEVKVVFGFNLGSDNDETH